MQGMKIYLLEKHSRHGVDYQLFELKSAPTQGLTTRLELDWYREYQAMTGDELKDIILDEGIYVSWYGVQEPIEMYPKLLPPSWYEQDLCIECRRDTSFGTGLFVNRLLADGDFEIYNKDGEVIGTEYRDGYKCAECCAIPCDRCDDLIPLDEDITTMQVYDSDDPEYSDDFSDGAHFVHLECLTAEEMDCFNKLNEEDK